MDSSRRQFVKLLPAIAMATGVAMKVGTQNVNAIEVKPSRRYVFRLPDYATQADVDGFRQTLNERQFSNSLIVSGAVEIYELQ